MTAAMPIDAMMEVALIHLLYMTLSFVVVLWGTIIFMQTKENGIGV
jgi:hypothetical protein